MTCENLCNNVRIYELNEGKNIQQLAVLSETAWSPLLKLDLE